MVFLTMILAVIAILTAAKHPTGPNSVSYDEPVGLWLSIGMTVLLFLPPFILAFFNHIAVKIISALYQCFIAFGFLGLILVVFFIPNGFWIGIIAIVGTLVTICSILVTIMTGLNR